MLFVNTEELESFGNYLISTKEELDLLLKDLNNKMSGISNGWNDQEGNYFVSKFNSFIMEANKISTEVDKLGKYAKQISGDYNKILNDSLTKMGD